jgi:hypothetical protein
VRQVTATYLHRHVSEFLAELRAGRTVEVVDSRFRLPIVTVRAVSADA